jgi:hypothetical protein
VVAPTSLSLSGRSKSSSKSKRDLDCVVPSDQFESDLTSSGASRVEVVSKTDIFLICRARSGSSNSSSSLLRVDVVASGFLELTRWLLKPPKPLVTQI